MAEDKVLKALVDEVLESNVHPDRRAILEEWREEHTTDEEREAQLTDEERAERDAKQEEDKKDTKPASPTPQKGK